MGITFNHVKTGEGFHLAQDRARRRISRPTAAKRRLLGRDEATLGQAPPLRFLRKPSEIG